MKEVLKANIEQQDILSKIMEAYDKQRLVLDLYTFRFGQKKLVRSEPSRIVKDSILSHHLSQPQLSKLNG